MSTGANGTRDGEPAVKVPTPEMRPSEVDAPLDLPPPDLVVALQVVGEGWELPLSPAQQNFALGTLPPPACDLSLPGKTFVSDRHCYVSRRGNVLTVTDNRSRNGTFFRGRRKDYGEVSAGESFRVANVKLLALDEHLRILRKHIAWALGYDAHAEVDEALALAADEDAPGLLVLGPADCEQQPLAEAIHRHGARRDRAFVIAEPPLRPHEAILARASRGTLFLDLDAVKPHAPFARDLLGSPYHVRPIVAARDRAQAEDALGEAVTRALRIIAVRPIVDRRDEVERLLDALLTHSGSTHRIRDIGEANLAALIANHKWRRNFADLRDVERRCRALLEAGNQGEAAKRLGITAGTLSGWISGLGMTWPRGDRSVR